MSKRRIGKANAVPESPADTVAMKKAETNAYTCCIGNKFIPLTYTNRYADIYCYNDAYYPIENVPTASGATAYDHPNVTTYILVFH